MSQYRNSKEVHSYEGRKPDKGKKLTVDAPEN